MKEYNLNQPQIPDNPYRILIIGASESGKTTSLFNLINQQPYIDKIYSYAKDPQKTKYQYLINKQEITDILMILKVLLNTQAIWMMQ